MLQKIDVPISQLLPMNYNVAISPGWRHTVHTARWVSKMSSQKTAQINGWDPDSDKWRKPQTRSRWSGTVSSLMLTKIPYVCKIITCFLEAQFYSFYLIQTLELSKVKNDDMQGACGPEIHAIILWLFLGFEYNWSFRSEDNLLKSVMMYLQFLVSHGQLLCFHNRISPWHCVVYIHVC